MQSAMKENCACFIVLNASGGCETAVTARVRIGWMKFKECVELLLGRFSLKMKGMVYRSCIRSAMFMCTVTTSPHQKISTLLLRGRNSKLPKRPQIPIFSTRNR